MDMKEEVSIQIVTAKNGAIVIKERPGILERFIYTNLNDTLTAIAQILTEQNIKLKIEMLDKKKPKK